MDLAHYEARLKAELQEIELAVDGSEQAAGTVMLDQASIGRVSRIDAIQQQAMAVGFQNRLLLRKRRVQAAIDRIANGTYGHCCECEELMESLRLESDPAILFCKDCATARES